MSNLSLNSEMKCCRKCGKPLPDGARWNTLYCENCLHENKLETWRKARRKSYGKHKERYKQEKREEYKWYKERGICVDCHQRSAAVIDGKQFTRCVECMTRFKQFREKKKTAPTGVRSGSPQKGKR